MTLWRILYLFYYFAYYNLFFNQAAENGLARPQRVNTMEMTNKNILVFAVNYLGDFICMLPLLSGLRKLMPDGNIILVTSEIGKTIISNMNIVDEIIGFEFSQYRQLSNHPIKIWKIARHLREKRIYASLSAHGECTTSAILSFFAGIPIRIGFRTPAKGSLLYNKIILFNENMHVIENGYRLLYALKESIPLNTELPELEIPRIVYPEDAGKKAKEIISELNCRKIVVIHPFAKQKYQEWPIENFIRLAYAIVDRNESWGCVFVAHRRPDIKIEHPRIKVISDSSLMDLVALIDKADVFVGNNSGPMHIAVSQNIKTIWIAGPTARCWDAFDKKRDITALSAGVYCQPCNKYDFILGKCTNTKHPNYCMKEISVERVFQEVKNFLERK